MSEIACPNPNCGKTYRVRPSDAGRNVTCKSCGLAFVAEPVKQGTVAGIAIETGVSILALKANIGDGSATGSPRQIGRFIIRQKLGQGAFGAVHRAYDPQLDRDVAVKIPQAGLLTSPDVVKRFLREAQAAARLNHPHIVPVYDAGMDGDQYYIATAFIDGRPLSEQIDDYRGNYRRIADLIRKLAEALDYSHSQGIVHRDIKPHNVMIASTGEPHLLDFGLAQVSDAAQKLTHDGTVMGTPAYMSPEQASGDPRKVTAASDQYSLAVIMYELLTGQTPFSGTPAIVVYNVLNQAIPKPRSRNPEIPRDLETICLRGLSRESGNRYPTTAGLAADLSCWLNDRPIQARRTRLVEHFGRWCRHNPAVAALVVIVFAVTGSGFGVTTTMLLQVEAARSEAAQHLKTAQAEEQRTNRERERARERATQAEAALAQVRQEQQRTKTATEKALQQERLAARSAAVSMKANEEAAAAKARENQALQAQVNAEATLMSTNVSNLRDAYWNTMVTAYNECRAGNFSVARALLNGTRPDPQFGCCWEWYQLDRFLTDATVVIRGKASLKKQNDKGILRRRDGPAFRGFEFSPSATPECIRICDATGRIIVVTLAKLSKPTQIPIQVLEYYHSNPADGLQPIEVQQLLQLETTFSPVKKGQPSTGRLVSVSLSPNGNFLLVHCHDDARNVSKAMVLELRGDRRTMPLSVSTEYGGWWCNDATGMLIGLPLNLETPPGSGVKMEEKVLYRQRLWDAAPAMKAFPQAGVDYPFGFSPDGTRILTSTGVFDAETGERLATITSGSQARTWMLSADNSLIAREVAGSDLPNGGPSISSLSRLKSVVAPKREMDIVVSHVGNVMEPVQPPIHLTGHVEVPKEHYESVVKQLGHGNRVGNVIPIKMKFFPDGTRLFSSSVDGTARLWRTDKTAPSILLLQSPTPIVDSDVSADARFVVCLTDDNEVEVFDAGPIRLESPAYLTAELKQRNLLKNGSFEDTEGGQSWVASCYLSNNHIPLVIDEEVAHDGKRAIQLRTTVADDARFTQKVKVKPKTKYFFCGWIKTKDVVIEQPGGQTGASLSIQGTYESSRSLVGTVDWTYVTLQFDTGDRRVVELCLRLGHHGSMCTGMAWFDDLCLIEIEDPKKGASEADAPATDVDNRTLGKQGTATAPQPTLTQMELAYVDRDGQIICRRFADNEKRVIPFADGTPRAIQWSERDHRLLALVDKKLLRLPDSGTDRVETVWEFDAVPSGISVTTDETRVAWLRFKEGESIPHVIVQQFNRMPETDLGIGYDPYWTRDGRHLVFLFPVNGFRIATWDGKVVSEISPPVHPSGGVFPTPSPDGKLIAFSTRAVDDTRQIALVSTDGTQFRQVTRNGLMNGTPAFTSDGRYVAYLREKPNISELAYVDLETDKEVVVAEDIARIRPAWHYIADQPKPK